MYVTCVSSYLRYYMGSRHPVHIPGEPKEIHPWHKDGLCRTEEEE